MPDKEQVDELRMLLAQYREVLTYAEELGIDAFEPAPLVRRHANNVDDSSSGVTEIPVSDLVPQNAQGFVDAPDPAPDVTSGFSQPLDEIRKDIGDCKRCPLYEGRTNVVHSEGNPGARLMFVGEAPGADEDRLARPFVGRAGQLLTKIIEAIGIDRKDVFIGNVNRCRPPANRPPTIPEAAVCREFLFREIAVVKPDVIVVMGNTAMNNLLDAKGGISKIRGLFQDFNGIKVMPTFHPAYLLRDPSKKREVWEDMKKVRQYLDSTKRN